MPSSPARKARRGRLAAACLTLLLAVLRPGTGTAQTADDFFNPAILHTVRLYVHPSDWDALRANFDKNTYYPCVFEWNGMLAEGAGIRSRGRGSRNGTKPGLNVDFDRYESDAEFLGLHSVVLDNLAQDPTLLRDPISMRLYRRMGVPAPRGAYARLYLNNQYIGLYAVTETVDKRFLQRNFGENDGYLYEYQWVEPYYLEYRGPDPSRYSPVPFKPVTHEKDPDPAPIEALIRTANGASDEDFAALISEYIDLPTFADHMAVESFLAEYDGIAGAFGMDNFYLYRFEKGNLSQFIPWDRDLAMNQLRRPVFQDMDRNALTAKAFREPRTLARFIATLRTVAALAGNGWLEQEVEATYNQIRQAVYEDTRKLYLSDQGFLAPLSNSEFEKAVDALRDFARRRSDFVLSELPEVSGPRRRRP